MPAMIGMIGMIGMIAMIGFFLKHKKKVMSFIIFIMIFTFIASLVPQFMYFFK